MGSRLALLLVASAMMLGQTSSDPSASVQGVVTNTVTGEPVLRAHVSLRPFGGQNGSNQPKHYGALTTAEGKFSITGMDPGRYQIVIDKTGFVASYDNSMLTLQAGDKKEDIKCKLIPTGAISGRVVYADGTPATQLLVMAVQGSNAFGQNARTDEKGQYRIGGLTPGKYRVRAMTENSQFPPEIRTDGTKEVNYAASYHPGVLLPQEAARVAVGAGSDAGGIDIQMVQTPIIRVSGTVGGLPPGTQNVHLMLRQGRSATGAGNVKPDGTFAVYRVNPGKYTLQAVWSSPSAQRMLSSPVDIEVRDASVDHVALQMMPPFDLSGTVEFEDDGARPQDPPPTPPHAGRGAQAQQIRRPPPRNIQFASIDAFGSQAGAEMAADGTFQVTGLTAGRYRVTPNWGPAYVKSMRVGSTQVDGGILDLRNGVPGNTLTVVMSSAMGSISGTVADDRGPATAAMVVLALPDWDGSVLPFRSMAAKSDGTFTLSTVPPGSYKIAAVDQADRAALTSGGDLTEMMDQMESIEIHANDKITKDLKIMKP